MALPKVGQSLKWLAACAVFVAGFEGLSTTAYHDKLAKGLLTVCYGETEGVKIGDHYTKKQCEDMLANKLKRYWDEIEPHIFVKLSDNEKIAYTSFAYNLGSPVFIRSSFLKLLNAGKHTAACRGMLVYNRTRSVGYVKGLDRRRHAEDRICENVDLEGPVQVIIPLAAHSAPDVTATNNFCSGSGQGHIDCPRDYPLIVHAPVRKPAPAPVCHGFWIFKACTLNGKPI